MNQLKMHLATRFFQKGRIYTWTTDLSQTAKSSQMYRSSPKAMPIKCFVSHRPPSREGGSVGRGKKNKSK